ncbi:MAG: hypothetical protein JNL98_39790, partial [Bryobacterales bacterium]|nr:hypothetical protein [Bryobacterales bacterium]
FRVMVAIRASVPAFRLEGYALRVVGYGFGGIPLDRQQIAMPRMMPGSRFEHTFVLEEKQPLEIRIDMMRPGGVSTRTQVWQH